MPARVIPGSERASQKAGGFIDASRLIVVEKENFATRVAAVVIPTVGDNRRTRPVRAALRGDGRQA